MKKHLACFLVLTIFASTFSFLTFSVSAANDEGVKVYSVGQSSIAGETVKIPVYISNNAGIMGFKLNFEYDSSVLTPVSVEYGEAIDYGLQDNIEGDSTPGNMCVYWSGTEDVSTDGIWFYISFNVNSKSVGETQIDISYTQADTFNENFDDVVLNCTPIVLTIENDTYTQSATFSLTSSDFCAGESFNLYLRADTITASGSASFTIPYNSQIFAYKSFTQSGVNATVENTDGILTVTVTDLSEQDSGSDILTFTFSSSENTVGGDYNFSSSATFNSQEAYCAPCTVRVTGGDMSGSVIYTEDFYALPGDTVEIPVNISNNTGIMGFRITFNYNPELLTPVSVAKGSVLTVGTLNDSITEENTGSFDVLWNYTENFTENGELLLLTFTVNEEADFSTADITVSYTQTDTFNESYSDFKLICNDIDGGITNFRPVLSETTVIKPTSKYIYSEINACSDISEILTVVNDTTLLGAPNSQGFYGTGSTATVKNSDTAIENYTIVIKGDINGDSVCDVLDAAELSRTIHKDEALTSAELEAIDFNESDSLDIADYQSTVNYILSK